MNQSAAPFSPKRQIRECSSQRPTMERTRMFSDIPFTPGRTPQALRTTRSISAPAVEAA